MTRSFAVALLSSALGFSTSSAALAHFQLGTHAPRDPELKAVYGSRAADVSFILSRGKLARVRYACYDA